MPSYTYNGGTGYVEGAQTHVLGSRVYKWGLGVYLSQVPFVYVAAQQVSLSSLYIAGTTVGNVVIAGPSSRLLVFLADKGSRISQLLHTLQSHVLLHASKLDRCGQQTGEAQT